MPFWAFEYMRKRKAIAKRGLAVRGLSELLYARVPLYAGRLLGIRRPFLVMRVIKLRVCVCFLWGIAEFELLFIELIIYLI